VLIKSRGIGLNIQCSFVPAPVSKSYPKWRWLRETAFSFGWNYLTCDLANCLLITLISSTPFFAMPVKDQLSIAILHGFRFWCGVQIAYDAMAIVNVIAGISSPSDWPPAFGSITEYGYTVRGIWGKTYHQFVKGSITTPGYLAVKTFGFREGSSQKKCTLLCMAFATSACVHMLGAIAASFEDKGLCQVVFFLAQPVGIAFEELVMNIGRKLGIKSSGK
jgi:hypothetical protein